jgi:hypothetical protein
MAAVGLVAASGLLASCAGRSDESPRSASAAESRASASPGSAAPSVWGLRAGLNVAALTCRGRSRADVAPAYRRLLTHHRELLASAYQAERQRRGGAAFDREQTRVYNRFANQRSPESFCRTAANVAKQASEMDSARLRPAAPHLLAQLERGLR